jgi:hypothetical protein
MLFNFVGYLIILLAAIQGAKPQITWDATSCVNYALVRNGFFTEMINMATAAYQRSRTLLIDETGRPQNELDNLRVVLDTFSSYFGGDNNPQQVLTQGRDIISYFSLINIYT